MDRIKNGNLNNKNQRKNEQLARRMFAQLPLFDGANLAHVGPHYDSRLEFSEWTSDEIREWFESFSRFVPENEIELREASDPEWVSIADADVQGHVGPDPRYVNFGEPENESCAARAQGPSCTVGEYEGLVPTTQFVATRLPCDIRAIRAEKLLARCNEGEVVSKVWKIPCDCGLGLKNKSCCLFGHIVPALYFNGIYYDGFYDDFLKELFAITESYNLLSKFAVERLDDQMLKFERDLFFSRVKRSFAYRFSCFLQDWKISDDLQLCEWSESEVDLFFSELYKVRRIMCDEHDYGMRDYFQVRLEAQGLMTSRVICSLMGTTNEAISDIVPTTTITDYVKNICHYFWAKLRNMFSFVSDKIMDFVQEVFQRFVNYLVRGVFGDSLSEILSPLIEGHKIAVASATMFAMWVMIRLMNIVGDRVANAIYNYAISGLAHLGGCIVAQEPMDYVTLLSTVCCAVIGLSIRDFAHIRKMIASAALIMAGGTVVANVFKMSLLLLPPALKMAFTYKFGTRTQRFELDAERWRAITQNLCAVSRLSTVLSSDSYREKVAEQVKLGVKLINQCPSDCKMSVRQTFMGVFTKIFTIHTNLITRYYSAGDRVLPFCFHVSGVPGIGKTFSVKHMINQAMGFRVNQMFSDDQSEEFMSGLLGHPVIVMDEFLLGPQDENYKMVLQYLTMNSTNEWRPKFASVDDPNVGIKGTTARPEVIVSINNTIWDNIDAKVNDAFQRRRRFVLDFCRSDRFIGLASNPQNVDLKKFTPEEQVKRVWMKVDVYPSCWNKNQAARKPLLKGLTYDEAINFVREQWEEHCELFSKVSENMHEGLVQDKSPDEILEEVMRDAYDIPTGPLGVMEALTATFVPIMAQGPVDRVYTPDGRYFDVARDELNTTGEMSTLITSASHAQVEDGLLRRLWNRVSGIGVPIRIGGIAAALVVLVTAVSNWGNGTTTEEVFAQSPKPNKSTRKPRRARNLRRASEPAVAQGPRIPVVQLGLGTKFVNAVAFGDKFFVTYAHTLDVCNQENKEWTLIRDGQDYSCPYNPRNVFVDEESDIIIVYLDDKTIPRFKDITKYFISEQEIEKCSNVQVFMQNMDRTYFSRAHVVSPARYVTHKGTKEVILESAAKYWCPTIHGDCGIPIQILTGPLTSKILGIHVAGTGDNCLEQPYGLATFVTQELLREVKDRVEQDNQLVHEKIGLEPVMAQGPDLQKPQFETQPNLIWRNKVSWNERVAVPTTTKLRPSAIAEYVEWTSTKQPAILSKDDPRANGVCPIKRSLEELYEASCPTLDSDLLERIENELFDHFDRGLDWVIGKRELTMEEACGGVPKYLNSLTIGTSPGYPLCHVAKKKGKSDFVWFEGQELKYTLAFESAVETRMKEMREYSGGELDHRFLGFLKDELRKESKISNVDTRMTFANDLISLVAFRRVYGCLLAALGNSFECTGFATGLNQYSKDMNGIYTFLTKIGDQFTAGDFGAFDKRYVKQVEQASYRVICRLASKHLGVTDAQNEFMVTHETACPIQIGEDMVLVYCSQKSGCFWTTPVNNITGKIYMMYVFYRKKPSLNFLAQVGEVVLGDDHIVAQNKNRIVMTAVEIQEGMKEIGQVYTSAFKDRELTEEFDTFDQVTFLGAIPRRLESGEWTGALRKTTLEETPLWTRDENSSLDQTVQQMLDCASQWDKPYFENYVRILKEGYSKAGLEWHLNDCYSSLHYSVSERTAASGADFAICYGQGPLDDEDVVLHRRVVRELKREAGGMITLARQRRLIDFFQQFALFFWAAYLGAILGQLFMLFFIWIYLGPDNCPAHLPNITEVNGTRYCFAQGPVLNEPGLTQIVTSEEVEQAREAGILAKHISNFSMEASQLSMDQNTQSWVRRGVYSWPSTATNGTNLVNMDVPFGLLTTTTTSNVQDLGFYQYLYSMPEIEIKIMVNGTPVQQGAAVAFFQPLYPAAFGAAADYNDYTTFDHVFLTPNNNTAVSLTIPMRYWKTWLNNKKGFTQPYYSSMGKIVVKVFSQLTTLTLPTTASISVYSSIRSEFRVPRPRTANGQGPMGASYSTTNVSNDYNIGSVTGNIPNQTTANSSSTAEGHLSGVPYDNPPMSGCSVPTHLIMPSMSKGIGIEPTVSLQFHHGMLHRQPDSLRFKDETLIEHICNRRGYMGTFNVATTDTTGSELLTFPINSVLSNPTPASSNTVPLNIAVLNQFQRFRCDFEIELFCAKTVFHSTRLLGVVGYGENGSLAGLDYDAYPGRIIEFTGETQWASTTIPFNCATEYLRTYDGNNTQNIDDYSLGQFSIIVLNPLKASSAVVSTTCACLWFVRMKNVQVYEPRTSVWVSLESGNQLYNLVGQGPMDASEAVMNPSTSSVNTNNTINVERMAGDDNTPVTVGVTSSSPNTSTNQTCKLKLGDKYEYCIKDITELGRRHTMFNIPTIDGYSTTVYRGVQGINTDYSTAGSYQDAPYLSFYVYPLHPIARIFAGWSGHLKYRFMYNYVPVNPTTGFLENFRVTYVPSTIASVTQTVNQFAGTVPPAAGTKNSTIYDSIVAVNGETFNGKTAINDPTWNANTYIYKPDTAISYAPIEYSVSQGGGQVIIDVSVPFNSNNNYLPTIPASHHATWIDPYNGRLIIQLPRAFANQVSHIDMFQAFGDDFRLHAYSPVSDHYADGYEIAAFGTGVITAPTAGQQIGQNVYGTHT